MILVIDSDKETDNFEVVRNGKRTRISATDSNSMAVSKGKKKKGKILFSVDTKKLNPVKTHRELSKLLSRENIKAVSREILLINFMRTITKRRSCWS